MAISAVGAMLPAYAGEPKVRLDSSMRLGGPSTYYPPTLTGMRGSHAGSFEVAHALAWQGQKPDAYESLDEHYDLVVVGAGMSGLAAAWYYLKKAGPEARVLVLDNHDDFGGHAKRNEFHHKDRMILSLGGAQNLDNPSNYGDIAGSLLIDLGIDEAAIAKMAANTPDDYVLGGKLGGDVGLTVPDGDEHLTIGGHWLKFFHGRGDYQAGVRDLPIPEEQKDKLVAFFGGEKDFLDDLSLTKKWDYVNNTSYNQFLVDRVGLSVDTIPILNAHLLILNGPSGWNHTVLEGILAGSPGLRAMGWLADFVDSIGAMLLDELAGDIRMFPDGNASVARLLVQKMIPDVAPNMKGFEDVAIARFNYGALDQADQSTRIRLNSTVVGVREVDDYVQIDYVQQGKPLRITANHCVLACYNNLIPALCPEMSDAQKSGLGYGVRIPFVYANILLENGRAFSELGVQITQCPYDPFQWVSAAPTVTSGGYEPPRGPDDPMVVFMMASPTPADGTEGTTRDLLRLGRHKIYASTFDDYEQQIREQLQKMLGKHGFNHEADIKAITVNRIPHGYAYWYQGLDDPEWEEGQAPHEIGRQQFGRISIANTDSEVTPLMNAAFDAAHRAVEEQTG
ncbi:MAG: NAD(P)-binding protein [Gammaproteobacteria bacterium]|nr:NAD(P)-binding protein [Gammaproteobacteria bacterium]